jgi:hypothetical protein
MAAKIHIDDLATLLVGGSFRGPTNFPFGLTPTVLDDGVEGLRIRLGRSQCAELAIEVRDQFCIIVDDLLMLIAGNVALVKPLYHVAHLLGPKRELVSFSTVPTFFLFG